MNKFKFLLLFTGVLFATCLQAQKVQFKQVDQDKKVEVFRNDEITLEEIERLAPTHLIISPGPKTPAEAGITKDVIKYFFPFSRHSKSFCR